ncbi:hypothetical protein NLU13_4495 [Sarocladium strictum]|uniref:Ribosomal RNA-processing protein 7 n=1 Tax=Sarocladium strictum TaxID=5046 RepID=A0AA39L8V8_SARSR|nr:hypothetical protein NLU13_4495 [Sarocladium strictum]
MAPLSSANDEFVVLPIEIPPTAAYPHPAVHEVLVRRNNPKIPTVNDSRSLFLKNIPVDSTESHFRGVFTHLLGAGRYETIAFEDDRQPAVTLDPMQALRVNEFARKRKRADVEEEERRREDDAARLPEVWTRRLQRSSSTAIVLLADEKSVQLALKAITKLQKSQKFPVWGEDLAGDVPSLGASWISEHLQLSRLNKLEAKAAVHGFFTVFNRKEAEAAELAKRLRNEPDEDGFVTVTRGGRAAPASRNEAEEAKQRMIDRQSKKKSELKDFYRFQVRERRKEEQQALVKRFQEDRKRVNDMREKRGKFKPET